MNEIQANPQTTVLLFFSQNRIRMASKAKLGLMKSPSQPLLESSLVTQRSSSLTAVSGDERCVTSDDPNNGCEGDHLVGRSVA